MMPGGAKSVDSISGKVTKLADGTALQSATVTVAGPHQTPLTQTTGADGTFSIEVAGGGPCTLGVSAAGFKSQALGDVSAGSLAPIALAPATYTPLPVDACIAEALGADARTGIFYALAAPEVYRSLDYGGTWQPVTMSYDDPGSGLRISPTFMAVSGVSGEVAVGTENGGSVSFSTDYGLSWRTVGGDFQPAFPGTLQVFWAHADAGAADVLLAAQPAADGSWSVWRADMSAATPAFAKEASDPFGRGSVIAVADSAGGSFVGRVSAAGSLSFAPLTASGPITFGPDEVTGVLTPLLLRLGGAREASAPPDGVLAVGGSAPYRAVMLTKDAGATSFAGASRSAITDLPDIGPFPVSGSVTPTTTGTSGAGNAGHFWLGKSGSDAALTIFPAGQMLPEGGDMVYDAGFGQSGDFVAMIAELSEPRKYARLDADGVPLWDEGVAAAGSGSASGGWSIRGITSAGVDDVAYGPGAGDMAIAAWQGPMASKDGGKTITEIMPRKVTAGAHALAVQWWQGASGEWLLFGGVTQGKMLIALLNWDGASTLTEPNVGGSTLAELGGPPQGYWGTGGYGVTALAAIPGTDTVFIGLGSYGEDKYGDSHLYRARLTATDPPALADVVKLDPAPTVATLYTPQAMAYCPDDPSVTPSMRDVLFVATGQAQSGPSSGEGSLLRITGASTSSPSVTVVGSIPHDSANTALEDVRVDGARGVVYAAGAGWNAQTGEWGGLYKSVDGGQTFTPVTVLAPGGWRVAGLDAIGLNPADPNDVTVSQGAMVFHSADGGTSWIMVHDPAVDRQSWVSDIEFAPGASSTSFPRAADRAATAAPGPALVGTGGGVFASDLAATSGLIATSGGAGSSNWAGLQITTLVSDGSPAMVVAPSTKQPLAVFQTSNGLYQSAATGGSWSLPVAIPGTLAGDRLPSLAVDRSGGLELAFRRTLGPAQGIYFAEQASGRWSAPQRVSSSASDTLPALVLTGTSAPRVCIVFLRSGRRTPGVYYASNSGGKWHVVRVPGTGAADAMAGFGGPSLAADGRGRLHLTFARGSGKRAGIYYALRGSKGWSALRRLTAVAGDRQPSLVVTSSGKNQLVFRRPGGRGHRGLFFLTGASRWSLARLPGTIAADTQPALTLNGSSLLLVFVRPVGTSPGIYYDRKLGRGRWLTAAQRRSTSRADTHPSIRVEGSGRVTILFERL